MHNKHTNTSSTELLKPTMTSTKIKTYIIQYIQTDTQCMHTYINSKSFKMSYSRAYTIKHYEIVSTYNKALLKHKANDKANKISKQAN